MQKTTTTLIGILALALIASGLWWLFSDTRANGESGPSATVPSAGEITIEGTVACLPHRGDGPHTMECAFGLRDDSGNYYGLQDLQSDSNRIVAIPTGTRVRVEGDFEPSDEGKYDTVGAITIDSIERLDTGTGEATSDGTIRFERPSDFGLAVAAHQVLAPSSVSPCEGGFDYCLYYNGNEYDDTNFESAGLSIQKRPDLSSGSACTSTPPEGYMNVVAKSEEHDDYSISMFGPLGDAATGHYTNGEQYRVFTAGTCYQITMQVGESQFENHSSGSIEEFTERDRDALLERLRTVVSDIELVESGTALALPR